MRKPTMRAVRVEMTEAQFQAWTSDAMDHGDTLVGWIRHRLARAHRTRMEVLWMQGKQLRREFEKRIAGMLIPDQPPPPHEHVWVGDGVRDAKRCKYVNCRALWQSHKRVKP